MRAIENTIRLSLSANIIIIGVICVLFNIAGFLFQYKQPIKPAKESIQKHTILPAQNGFGKKCNCEDEQKVEIQMISVDNSDPELIEQ